MSRIISIVITCIVVITSLQVEAQRVEEVTSQLSRHRYRKVWRMFDANMKEKVTVKRLKEVWRGIEEVSGQYEGVEDIQDNSIDGRQRYRALLRFENGIYRFLLASNEDNKIDALFIQAMGYNLPDYGKNLKVGKRFLRFQTDTLLFSGELIVPVECNNCPIVIMVHGSGPNNKDETIGPNKVFQDLALGLASQGIASYRYDKRFFLYPELAEQPFDLYDETIDDAISAYTMIKADTSLHFGKHIMLGHSLGAFAMPLIADSLNDLDGAILFSGNARRIEDLIEYQMNYLTNYDDKLNSAEKKLIKKVEKGIERIRNGNYDENTPYADLLAYWPGKFWKGIAPYDPVAQLRSNTKTNFLILQGEDDYQITMEDYALWRANVATMNNVEMLSFPGLTHLFTPSKGQRPGPADYFIPNNVSYEVIVEIAAWIGTL